MVWSRVFASFLLIGTVGCSSTNLGTSAATGGPHREGGVPKSDANAGPEASRDAGSRADADAKPTAMPDGSAAQAPPPLSAALSIPDPSGSQGATYPDEPALAFGRGVYLMAWVDERLDLGSQVSDVFIARFDEAGDALDSHPIAIGMGLQEETHPSVAFDGSYFLVTWFRYGTPPYNGGGDSVGVRVKPSGEVLDETPIIVLADSYGPAVASGGRWIVGAADVNDSSLLRFAEVGSNGIAAPPRTIRTGPDSYGKIARGASTLLSMGHQAATLIDTATWTARPMMTLAYPNSRTDVAWSGEAYYLPLTGLGGGVLRMAEDGTATVGKLADAGGAIAASSDKALIAHWTATWEMAADLIELPSMRALAKGILEPAQPPETVQAFPAVARSTNGFGVGWVRRTNGPAQSAPKLATIADIDGGANRTTSVPLASPDQLSPAVAADDAGFSLVWTENAGGGSDVRLLRYDASGTAIDPNPIAIAKGRNPAVARRAGRTLIFWEDSPFVIGARIDDAETVPHLEDRPSDASANSPVGGLSWFAPAVAATTDGFVLALAASSDTGPTINTSVLDPDWPATPPVSSDLSDYGYGCRLAGAGAGYLRTSGSLDHEGQYAGDVSASLVRGANRLSLSVASDGAEPSAGYGANRVLVAYRSGATDAPKTVGAKVFDATTGALVGSGVTLDAGTGHGDEPSVAFDGRNFWVVFRHIDGGRSDIVGARVSPDGALLDSSSFAISDDPEADLSTSIAANAKGRVIIAYSRFDLAVGAARIEIRWGN